jgi:hypothetical protein
VEAEALPWSEARIGRALVHSQLFQRKIVIVPRCHWAGHEADLLAIHQPSLRLIDIEIKISRADLLADPKKDKWWERRAWDMKTGDWKHQRMREWPPKVWKHYYAMPADIWRKGRESLEPKLPKASGVILLGEDHTGLTIAWLARRAQGNPKAAQLGPVDVMDLARLAGLRMWDALAKAEQ